MLANYRPKPQTSQSIPEITFCLRSVRESHEKRENYVFASETSRIVI